MMGIQVHQMVEQLTDQLLKLDGFVFMIQDQPEMFELFVQVGFTKIILLTLNTEFLFVEMDQKQGQKNEMMEIQTMMMDVKETVLKLMMDGSVLEDLLPIKIYELNDLMVFIKMTPTTLKSE